ncbi:MAG TPA: porin family protein [Allosphingosinicella sp.]|jgi:outer membrane immunogenic protein
MLKYCLAAVLTAAAVASPVLAEDTETVAAGKPADFTGFKVEGLAGYDEGFVYGIGAGYDRQLGRLILGVEGEISDSTDKECLTGAFAPADRFCASSSRNLYVGGRIGYTIAPRTLLYGKIGYTNQRLKADYTAGTPAALDSFSISRKLDGIRLGAGIEQKLGGKAYLKGEYRYSDYEDGSFKHDGVVGIGFRF